MDGESKVVIKCQKCQKCGSQNDSDRYFCLKCGSFLRSDIIHSPDLYELPQFKMIRLLENFPKIPHMEILWDDTVNRLAKRIEQLNVLMKIPELREIMPERKVSDDMTRFISLCRKPEFQIAFVGTIKTGKSTLINALLGGNYASVDVTPETAALTKFRYSLQDYVKVCFYSKEEWEKLWQSCTSSADKFLEEYKRLDADNVKDKYIGHEGVFSRVQNFQIGKTLTRWSSSRYAEHYFVKEIEVGISTLPAYFPHDVIFVDTPGLSDPVAYRSDITREYIKRANAVFVCVDAQKIYKEEVGTIASVFSFSGSIKDKVHIIATHWDVLNNPEADWKRQMEFFETQLVGKGFFETPIDAKSNIIPSAAYIHNLCREYRSSPDEIKNNAKNALIVFALKLGIDLKSVIHDTEKYIPLFMEKANIETIEKRIMSVLVKNRKTWLSRDLKRLYENILYVLRRVGEEQFSLCQSLITSSYGNVSAIKKALDAHEKNLKEFETIRGRLLSVLKTVENQTRAATEKALELLDEVQNHKGKGRI